jgi:PAS domain S-box-containing protein
MLFPFQASLYLDLPRDLVAWLGWAAMLLAIAYFARRWLDTNLHWGKREWAWLAGLTLSVLLTTPFLGVRLSIQGALPLPERPALPNGPALMFLMALPWMVAGGLLGVIPATALGALSGVILSLLDTHNPFSALEIAGVALLFSAAMRQRYRTPFFRLLRHPVFAAALLSVGYAPVYLYSLLLTTPGPLVGRVDYATSHFTVSILAVSGSLIISSLITEVISQALPQLWGRVEPLRPSPSEASLLNRVISNIVPGAVVLVVFMMVGAWFVSINAARSMLEDRLSNTAQLASEGIPYFLATGQNLVLQFAGDDRLLSSDTSSISQILGQDIEITPFFRQLLVLGPDQAILTSYPSNDPGVLSNTAEEKALLDLAFSGVQFQEFTEAPLRGETTAQVVFLASLKDASGRVTRVLWGRTDLFSNPFTGPVIKVLADMSSVNGEGLLIDENGNILYHPVASQLMTPYLGKTTSQPEFIDQTAPDGTRQLVFYQPVPEPQWAIALIVPATQIQQMALNIAVPLLVMVFFLALIASLSLFFGLKAVTRSLVTLSGEARRISQGQLDHALPPPVSVDEVGRLRDSFEQMRLSLKARLEELNRLLQVSQGVAASLEIEDAIRPILEAAFTNKACMARVVLVEDHTHELFTEIPGRFGIGPASGLYAPLDDEILKLAQKHETVSLSNLTHGRALNIPKGMPRPAALIAVALRHEARFFGALWVAYDNRRTFSEEETRFLHMLAAEAAMAAANAQLYASAEVGRQRLEAILASTPEPVLVTDQQNRIMLTNPAALQLPSLGEISIQGQPVSEMVSQNDLLGLLTSADGELTSREIAFPNGKVYYATVSPVMVEKQLVGKVCILRDITHYKELDSLKSEFVATVSHDLRLPLTLMRGYATMLQMVGDLNEQQKGYMRKVINGVENMSRLVNNLLDLGRIEAGVGLQLSAVSAGDVVEHVISSLQLQAAQKEIQFSVQAPETGQTILEADPALLQQAVFNLVENAVKYTPMHGKVQVEVLERPQSILFSVRDSGIGIAPIDQPRMFEKFYLGGQREANQQRGSGLGLAIVKSIVERHGGQVWLESTLGKGSTFYLELPRNISKDGKKGT